MKAEEIKVKITVEKWFTEANNAFAEIISKRVGESISEREAIEMAGEFALAMVQNAVKVERRFDSSYHPANLPKDWFKACGEISKPVVLDGKEIVRLLSEEVKLSARKAGVIY